MELALCFARRLALVADAIVGAGAGKGSAAQEAISRARADVGGATEEVVGEGGRDGGSHDCALIACSIPRCRCHVDQSLLGATDEIECRLGERL